MELASWLPGSIVVVFQATTMTSDDLASLLPIYDTHACANVCIQQQSKGWFTIDMTLAWL